MNKNELKQQLIERLEMIPHPEGGYFHETYRSEMTLSNGKSLFSSIYFLLEEENISHFHRIESDELWYFHGGDALTIHMIQTDGSYSHVKLGLDITNGEVPQYLVPKHTIFASAVEEQSEWSLVGCMVSPGFTFEEFKLYTQDELLSEYPAHQAIISKYALKEIPK